MLAFPLDVSDHHSIGRFEKFLHFAYAFCYSMYKSIYVYVVSMKQILMLYTFEPAMKFVRYKFSLLIYAINQNQNLFVLSHSNQFKKMGLYYAKMFCSHSEISNWIGFFLCWYTIWFIENEMHLNQLALNRRHGMQLQIVILHKFKFSFNFFISLFGYGMVMGMGMVYRHIRFLSEPFHFNGSINNYKYTMACMKI